MSDKRWFTKHIQEQDKEILDLIAKCIEIISSHSLWNEENKYVFKDGESWSRYDPEWEIAKNTGKLEEIDSE